MGCELQEPFSFKIMLLEHADKISVYSGLAGNGRRWTTFSSLGLVWADSQAFKLHTCTAMVLESTKYLRTSMVSPHMHKQPKQSILTFHTAEQATANHDSFGI